MDSQRIFSLVVLPLLFLLSGHTVFADNRLPSVTIPPINDRLPEVRRPQLSKPDLSGAINREVVRIRRFRRGMLPPMIRHLQLPRKTVAVEVAVKLRNSGQLNANRFRVDFRTHISGVGDRPSYPGSRLFSVGAGQIKTIKAWLFFPPGSNGKSVQLYGKIDGCAGVEFAKPYCRVDESNENNNNLRPIEFFVPHYNDI